MDLGMLLGMVPRRQSWRYLAVVSVGLGAVVLMLMIGRPGHPEPRAQVIVVHGFSVLADVFAEGLAPAFQRDWMARTGKPIAFAAAFKSLGSVTNELLGGLPAELAFLSPEFGARQLIAGGILPADALSRLPHRGVFTETPLVLVVRPGNPRGIRDFADLTRPGLQVVHCDPRVSGGGYWAILAAHGSAWRRSGSTQDGYEMLLGIWRNVSALGATARETRALFQDGPGDALITYEQDALWGIQTGDLKAEIVYPRSTIVAEVCVAVLDRHVDPDEAAAVEAFTAFLWSPPAQRLLRHHGFRGLAAGAAGIDGAFPAIVDPFRISDLGGWKQARTEILDDAWRRVQREVGK